MNITYKDLLADLNVLSEEQLEKDATVRLADGEYYGISWVAVMHNADVVDNNTPVLVEGL